MPADLALRPDGRQSATAAQIQRGVCRLLRGLGFAAVTELVLADGRRADVVGLSQKGEIWLVEIKSSAIDLRADLKWPLYRAHCDKLFFAAPETLDSGIFPEDTGLMVADAYGAALLRDAPEHKLSAAARKALWLRIARAAAFKLHGIVDPGASLV